MSAEHDSLDELIRKSFAEEIAAPAGMKENLLEKMAAADRRRRMIPVACAVAAVLIFILVSATLYCNSAIGGKKQNEMYQAFNRQTENGGTQQGGTTPPRTPDSRTEKPASQPDDLYNGQVSGGESQQTGEADAGDTNMQGDQGRDDVTGSSDGQDGKANKTPEREQSTSSPDRKESYYEVADIEAIQTEVPEESQPETEQPAAEQVSVYVPGGVVIPVDEAGDNISALKTAHPAESVLPAGIVTAKPPQQTPWTLGEGICTMTQCLLPNWENVIVYDETEPLVVPAEPELPKKGDMIPEEDSQTESVVPVISSHAELELTIWNLQNNSFGRKFYLEPCRSLLQKYDDTFFATHLLCVAAVEECDGSSFVFDSAQTMNSVLYISILRQQGESVTGKATVCAGAGGMTGGVTGKANVCASEADMSERAKVCYLCLVEVEKAPVEGCTGFQIKFVL